jgi:hypothetical protein
MVKALLYSTLLSRFAKRGVAGVRCSINLGKRYPKKLEAIGLAVLLLAAFFQFQSDFYYRWIMNCRLEEIHGEVEYTRQKMMSLIECQSTGKCSDWQRDATKAESYCFIPLAGPERAALWQCVRYLAFLFGCCLVIAAKWFDGVGNKS